MQDSGRVKITFNFNNGTMNTWIILIREDLTNSEWAKHWADALVKHKLIVLDGPDSYVLRSDEISMVKVENA